MVETYGYELESCGLTVTELEQAVIAGRGIWGGHHGYHGGGTNDALRYNTNNVWKSNTDGSLRNHLNRGICHEVISPILYGIDGHTKMRMMCKSLVRAGAEVNASCGTHVTIGIDNSRVRRFSVAKKQQMIARIGEAYDYFFHGFNHLVSASRRSSTWCSRPQLRAGNNFGQGTAEQNRMNVAGFGRGAVNINKYFSHGVIEFRQHNGTLNGKKLTNWSLLLTQLVRWARNDNHPNYGVDIRNYSPDLEGLMDLVNVGSELRTALVARAAQARGNFPHNRYEAAYQEYQHDQMDVDGSDEEVA